MKALFRYLAVTQRVIVCTSKLTSHGIAAANLIESAGCSQPLFDLYAEGLHELELLRQFEVEAPPLRAWGEERDNQGKNGGRTLGRGGEETHHRAVVVVVSRWPLSLVWVTRIRLSRRLLFLPFR